MPDDKTLLAHLVLKLAPHPENIAVEALGHILSMSPAAVRALEDVLRTGGAEVGEIAKVKTQASGEEGTRPDLAGFDQHNKERVLIEAKFWAGLTDKQPVAYLNRLRQNRASALLFIAPAERFESLWTELHRRVKEAKIELVLGHEETNLRSATVGGERRLMLISWAALLGRMVSWASTAGESHTEYDIQQLRGLAEQMDEDAFLPLRPEELGPEFPRRLINLSKLVNDVIKCLKKEKIGTDFRQAGRQSANSYGSYFKLSGAVTWFGLDHYKWAESRDTPLWLYFNKDWGDSTSFSRVRNNLRPLGLKTPSELFEADNELVIPIYLPVGVEYDAVRNAVVERIKEIGRRINPAD